MSRRLELSIGNDYSKFVMMNFDFYGVVLYYAYTIDQSKALQLYKGTISEYYYKLTYDLPLGGLTDADTKVYLPINEFPQVINFINNQILVNLNLLSPSQDLTKLWNVGDSLESFLGSKGGFFLNFGIDDIEIDGYSAYNLTLMFTSLRDFLQFAYSQNTRYDVTIA